MNEVIYVEKRPDTLFRYSERKWLESSLYEGIFRLSSASYIKSLEEDAPRQDDEMRMEYSISKENIVMSCEKTGRRLTPIYDLTITDEIVTDYYMLCLTTKNSKYMFDEFKGSDSYLTIHDTEEFSRRIFEASDISLPDWAGIDKRITYGGDSQYGTAFMKPRDYMFQFEWRYAWLPLKQKEKNLDCIFLNIGNIEDIAEIIDKS